MFVHESERFYQHQFDLGKNLSMTDSNKIKYSDGGFSY